ncbi:MULTISPECIES: GMP/IMP nucleotidase [unclassified Agarivorans]|uniref:GMP/IMP nucleotidase n=1 Tax=unclassified Agarivorans TaxID=2636026 RepID=UPI0010E80BF3|nr:MULTISPECIES: GMP/IMP nucleotidase [unclassified Agarivorans]MDO6765735.1 GMP/IMP nucleotidase [Agarivorans sp. 1_MG-2023]GDY27714.1 GMP/IMP nucleotidase [Agarivorans sp. Toyoura001]
MFDWTKIDTVLLDMDGTLLDLHYDNYFWMHYLPISFAHQNGLSLDEARERLFADYETVSGTLDWYCFDYWSNKTNIDIRHLKTEVEHKIQWRDDVKPFLEALAVAGKNRVLLTNCHPDGLATKIKVTGLNQYLDTLFSTHQFGFPKEDPKLWQALIEHHPFDPERTLFIDDNEHVLEQAHLFGIKYLLGIRNPDSKQASKEFTHYPSIDDYHHFTKELLG